eukprot:1826256-Pyramimonas_sp.AAC.1
MVLRSDYLKRLSFCFNRSRTCKVYMPPVQQQWVTPFVMFIADHTSQTERRGSKTRVESNEPNVRVP